MTEEEEREMLAKLLGRVRDPEKDTYIPVNLDKLTPFNPETRIPACYCNLCGRYDFKIKEEMVIYMLEVFDQEIPDDWQNVYVSFNGCINCDKIYSYIQLQNRFSVPDNSMPEP